MKIKITYTLLLAVASCGMALGTTYYFEGKQDTNLFVPGIVYAAVWTGAINGTTTVNFAVDTLTLPASPLTANALNELPATGPIPIRATHYVEITGAGANQGVVIDIVSNTSSTVTLASDISVLSLLGNETIEIHPHVTLKSVFADAETAIAVYSDNATFYETNGIPTTYYFDGADWTSLTFPADGTTRPIPPGTGFILTLTAATLLEVNGETKTSPVVVQLAGSGVPNIVGPVNPNVGSTGRIMDFGFADMAPFSDSLTIYTQGGTLLPSKGTYFALGEGNVSTDFVTSSMDTIAFTIGGVLTTATDSSLRINSQ